MPDDIIAKVVDAVEIDDTEDILFACGSCGKSLVIERGGAGLTIHCPDCGSELQVPIPEDVDLAEIDKSITAALDLTKSADTVSFNLDVLPPELQTQVQSMLAEIEELRQQLAFQEFNLKSLSALKQELNVIETAFQKIREILTGFDEANEKDIS